jgi:hypothetical protein
MHREAQNRNLMKDWVVRTLRMIIAVALTGSVVVQIAMLMLLDI